MKLMTKDIERRLPKTYSTEGTPENEKKVIVKFFTPWTNWTWYVTEGEYDPELGWVFFGLVHGFEKEWGQFTLEELESIRGPAGLKVERDLYLGDVTIGDIK